MRTITTTKEVYTFSELSESAKETARDKYREHNLDYEWWDSVYDDAKAIGALFGLSIDRIYFSGFWSQGDGACFEGYYNYRKGGLTAVKAYAPQDTELHGIVARLQQIQRKAFYRLCANTEQRGRHQHSGCMRVSVDCTERTPSNDEYDEITDELRSFADWIYSRLESEYEYLQSDDVIDEYLSELEFDEDGVMQ